VQALNGKWAAEVDLDPPEKRGVKTKAGHLILFDDKSGEELIRVFEGVHSHEILLDKNGITVTDGVNSHTLKFDSSGVEGLDPGRCVRGADVERHHRRCGQRFADAEGELDHARCVRLASRRRARS